MVSQAAAAVFEEEAEAEAATESESPELAYPGVENSTLTGTFELHRNVASAFLDHPRDVLVYLPPGYAERETRYPVLYMHDGQNIFDAATAFGGNEWHVDETAEGMIAKGEITPLIIVGVYNTGEKRIDEYTPTVDRKHERGGGAEMYARFLVEELKPLIDEKYRTESDRANTAIAGSSLGGLVSLYIGLRYPHVFGKVAAMSPSVWWDRRMILRPFRSLRAATGQKVWLDVGSDEGRPALQNVRDLRELLIAKGWTDGETLGYLEAAEHAHDEAAWAARMGAVLGFLFPAP